MIYRGSFFWCFVCVGFTLIFLKTVFRNRDLIFPLQFTMLTHQFVMCLVWYTTSVSCNWISHNKALIMWLEREHHSEHRHSWKSSIQKKFRYPQSSLSILCLASLVCRCLHTSSLSQCLYLLSAHCSSQPTVKITLPFCHLTLPRVLWKGKSWVRLPPMAK